MGEVSTHIVPHGSYVRIPMHGWGGEGGVEGGFNPGVLGSVGVVGGWSECYRMCRCGGEDRLHHCVHNLGCVREDQRQCLLQSGMIHCELSF